MKVEGLSELNAQLVDLGNELAVKALAQAARKAFKPVLDDARSLVPVDSGALRDSLKLSVVKPKGDGGPVVVVGIRVGKSTQGNPGELPPARRWHFIELGTSEHAAQPFLRPALDRNVDRVLDGLKAELVKSIARAVKKRGGA